MRKLPQLLIAAPTSGAGKTTVSRGLMALLTAKGFRVQPFKCGPDYIDTKFHAQVCHLHSYNLDTFMASHNHVRQLYAQKAQEADACIVEGMMGMFDGYDRDKGSCAEISSILGLPVVLVVNAQSAAYSMAPLLNGFIHFKENVKVAGVIFNKVGSERHFAMLQQVCDDLQLRCFGYLPKRQSLEQTSRYLGLDFSKMSQEDELAYLIDEYVDWQGLMEATSLPLAESPSVEKRLHEPIHTLVARSDDSFSFIYAEHLDMLHRLGKVSFFNPEEEMEIPTDIDLLYLPGGYPEKHAEALVKSAKTRESVRKYIEQGGKALAECGGMIYLSQGIVSDEGSFEMAGVLPFSISMRKQDRKLSLGYRQFCYNGQPLRGHEFHYTQFVPMKDMPESAIQVYDAKGNEVPTPVFRYKNLISSYTHLYWGETDIMKLFRNNRYE